MAALGSGSGSRARSCPRLLLRRGLGAKLSARQISGAGTLTRALASPFPEDAPGLWPHLAPQVPRQRSLQGWTPSRAEGTGMAPGKDSPPGEGQSRRGGGEGQRPGPHPEPAGRMEPAPARGGRARGGGRELLPGSRIVWALPGSPGRPSQHARVSEVHSQEKKLKKKIKRDTERKILKRKLSCQTGETSSSCSLAGEAARSGHPKPGCSQPHLSLLTLLGSHPSSQSSHPARESLWRAGPEPSAGGGRGKPRSAGWHLRRALPNPDISTCQPSLHLPRGPAPPERRSPAPGAARAEVLHILGTGERFWGARVG